jgi:hypothetical protein
LGAEWEPGNVGVNGPLSWIGPSLALPIKESDFLTLSWDMTDDAYVAQRAGAVLAVGEVFGYNLMGEGTLDEMLAKIVREWQKRKDKKQRGWLSR